MALPAAGRHATLDVSLDGDWLLKPAPDRPAAAADPTVPDQDWHVVRVPSFWNPTGWWLFSGGDLKASASESFYCEELRRCERQTFDSRRAPGPCTTASGWWFPRTGLAGA